MKTIVFFTAKRARTPKMQGLATAAGSASVIRELCRLARCGKGRVYLVDAPTAEHGRRRITAVRAGDKPDIGALPMTTVLDNGRVVAIGANACLALAGASEAIRHWGCASAPRRQGQGARHRCSRSSLRRYPAQPARRLRRRALLARRPLSAAAGGGAGVRSIPLRGQFQ